MFDKFGEFDSAIELNKAAAGLKEEGDLESLKVLAIENGLDQEDAEDYADDIAEELATPLMAALGKLKVEAGELKPKEIMSDWMEYIKVRCSEDEHMAVGVRRKEKNLKGCIAALLKWSFANQIPVDNSIIRAAGVSAGKVTLGIPGMKQAKKIISEYYVGK